MKNEFYPCQKAFAKSLRLTSGGREFEAEYGCDCDAADVHIRFMEMPDERRLRREIPDFCLVHCRYLWEDEIK